jgi:hypothetical protein
VIAMRSAIDIPTAVIAIGSVLALVYVKKLPEPAIIAIAAMIGIIIKFDHTIEFRLKRDGHELIVTSDGREALLKIEKHLPDPAGLF